MLIAGEASGDLRAAELVSALLAASKRSEDGRVPPLFGAGGFTNRRNECKHEPRHFARGHQWQGYFQIEMPRPSS
jgi:hypothetical protein